MDEHSEQLNAAGHAQLIAMPGVSCRFASWALLRRDALLSQALSAYLETVPETQKLFPTTRTERQLQNLGIGPWALTPAAAELFARRHRLDVLTAWAVGVPVLAVYVVACWPQFSFPDHPSKALSRDYALHTGGATAFFGVMTLLASAVRRRLDRRIAATLPVRVTRSVRISPWIVLGKVRSGFLVVAVLSQLVMAVAMFAADTPGIGAYRWGCLAAFLACATSAFVGLRWEWGRPAVAVDAVSLAIDERLRSQAALSAISPLMFLAFVSNGGLLPLNVPLWLFNIGLITTGACWVMWFWAQSAKPWPKPEPAPWLVQLAGPTP